MLLHCLFLCLAVVLVRSVECSGIHIRRVLFGLEGPLGLRMLCQTKGMIVNC